MSSEIENKIVALVKKMNRGKDVRRSAALIKARRPIDPAALGDQDVDVKKLASALVRGA